MKNYKEIKKEIEKLDRKILNREQMLFSQGIFALPYFCLGLELSKYIPHEVAYHVAGALFYLTGTIADMASTIALGKEDEKFYKKYGEHISRETNPYLPEHPTLKDMLGISKKTAKAKIAESFGLGLSTVFPPISLSFFVGRSFIAMNNLLIKKHIKLEDRLREEKQKIKRGYLKK